ncbi:MAG: hypothetical protein ACOH12_02450 [Parvibaculaceae bacterium]
MTFLGLGRQSVRTGAVLLALGCSFALSSPAHAGPTACTDDGAGTTSCALDQSDGISVTVPEGATLSSQDSKTVTVNGLSDDIRPASGTVGIYVFNRGKEGTHDGARDNGDTGGYGANLTVNILDSSHYIETYGNGASGIFVHEIGGEAGNGGDAGAGDAGNGGAGGPGGTVTIDNHMDITTNGDYAVGIHGRSVGGLGGVGGDSDCCYSAGSGGGGGAGGAVSITNAAGINTFGKQSFGIFAQSLGGNGSKGGNGYVFTSGATGGAANKGGAALITNNVGGDIHTYGIGAHGVYAQSQGGFGGSGGSSAGFVGWGGSGSTGGNGGTATIYNYANVTTELQDSHALFAQSIGGGGGNGGSGSGIVGLGASGSGGGYGDDAAITNEVTLITYGAGSRGIFAQSVGGGGGDGGSGSGIAGVGGSGSGTSPGGNVTVTNSGNITTYGVGSYAIEAQSIGGGGGDGGASAGLVSIGGSGGGGGDGGDVLVTNSGDLITHEVDAAAIFAESVGGGGGAGGNAAAGGPYFSFAMGGSGGAGGKGGDVTVNVTDGSIHTSGARSYGVQAQSVGGGGGKGGFAIAASVGDAFSAAISIGGWGGDGGNGAIVNVTSDGDVYTTGDDAHAVFAQSLGGGGGAGGFSVAAAASLGASGTFSLGGTGGKGGDGDQVTVNVGGIISTTGFHSHGVFAQSVGGGGGSGGMAIAGAIGAGGTFGGAIGGGAVDPGAEGGEGKEVTVTNGGDITTTGDMSDGIFAQSVGGGGGDGGFAISGGMSATAAVSLGVGGYGSKGGSAAKVMVTNNGTITTSGMSSHGILAQSVGGGGGNGGMSIAGAIGAQAAGSLSIGGSGGAAGNGGEVEVTNEDNIITRGFHAFGILAQSVGGGGGDGGMSVAGSIAKSGAASLALGGSGGSGGTSGVVKVTNNGTITTSGADAHAIFAQSLGGGGGSGGMSIAGSATGPSSANAAVSIGGAGGDGNFASTVMVINTGTISTSGSGSRGIFAQSVGGGGGAGGMSIAGSVAMLRAIQASVSIGGAGGDGNYADKVTVTNSGTITTTGPDATAIFAQSIGGGGGSGGASVAGSLALVPPSGSYNTQINVAIGGAGGDGSNGGEVVVGNTNTLSTTGDNSHGIFAQSVGGGGGSGGNARTMALILGGTPFVSDTANSLQLSVAVGGNGGGASDGNIVTVTNSGTITTQGADSFGIFAQSIGGGGGTGGEAAHGLYGVPTIGINGAKLYKDLQAIVGGQGGASGDGMLVTVLNSGTIRTHGDGSGAIFAQSVGGGGGTGGVGSGGLTGKITIAGQGGAAGDSGGVTITNSGTIETFGVAANGIEAQSIGGGGGKGGDIDRGFLGFGIVPTFGLGGGSSGNGGDVLVTNTSNITTHASGSAGIVAQSVGGGGGMVGDLGAGLGYMGSAGGAGTAGTVTVVQTGTITTTGEGSHGIIAQSAAGLEKKVDINGVVSDPSDITNTGPVVQANAGAVNVTVNGSINVSGKNADGIVAQSLGGTSNGNITINITGTGTVSGGTDDGAAVRILDGKDNTLTSYGSLTTQKGMTGLTVVGGAGNDTFENYGRLYGLVDLGGGTNHFNNHVGAEVISGSTIDIGAGNIFDNFGHFSPGGVNAVQTTALTGSFVQHAGGLFDFDLDLADMSYDHLDVSGTATMGGTMTINYIHPGSAKSGDYVLNFLTATGGVANDGMQLSYAPSAVITYNLLYPDANNASLGVNVNFAPPSGADLAPNDFSIGNYLNEIQSSGSSPALDPLMTKIFTIGTPEELAAFYKTLSPESYNATGLANAAAGQVLATSMLSCRVYGGGSFRFTDEGECNWAMATPRVTKLDKTAANMGSETDDIEFAFGQQRAIADHYRLGFGLSYTSTNSQVEDYARSSGDRFQAGLVGKMVYDPLFVALAFTGGYSSIDSDRYVKFPSIFTTASSSQSSMSFGTRLRVATQLFGDNNFYVRPMVDVNWGRTRADGFAETGAGPLDLIVASQWYNQANIIPSIELGGEFSLFKETKFRPYASYGITRVLTGSNFSSTASFEGAPAGAPAFTVSRSLDDTLQNIVLGFDVMDASGFDVRVYYTSILGDTSEQNSVSVKLGLPF